MTASNPLALVTIFTDGSTYPTNPGYAGWSAIIRGKHWIRIITGGQEDRSNNFAETKAVAEALRCLKKPCQVRIFTDSQYVVFGFRKINNKRSFKTNLDVWQEIFGLVTPHKITCHKVAAHTGVPMNCWADELAAEAAKMRSSFDGYIPVDVRTDGQITTNKSGRRKILSLACSEKV